MKLIIKSPMNSTVLETDTFHKPIYFPLSKFPFDFPEQIVNFWLTELYTVNLKITNFIKATNRHAEMGFPDLLWRLQLHPYEFLLSHHLHKLALINLAADYVGIPVTDYCNAISEMIQTDLIRDSLTRFHNETIQFFQAYLIIIVSKMAYYVKFGSMLQISSIPQIDNLLQRIVSVCYSYDPVVFSTCRSGIPIEPSALISVFDYFHWTTFQPIDVDLLKRIPEANFMLQNDIDNPYVQALSCNGDGAPRMKVSPRDPKIVYLMGYHIAVNDA